MGMWNPVKEAKKIFKELKKDIEEAASKGKRTVEGVTKTGKRKVEEVVNEGKHKVEQVTDEAFEKIEKKAKEAGNELEKVGDDIEETFEKRIPEIITEKLPELLDDALNSMAEAITKEGLSTIQRLLLAEHAKLEETRKNKPELIAEIDKLGGGIFIGPCKLNYTNFYSRLTTLADIVGRYVKNPPRFNRRDIIAMVIALGPDTVNAGADINFNAVVVGSSALAFGGSLNDIGIGLAAELLDTILEEVGVPA